MAFDCSSEQRLLRDALSSFLADTYDPEARRKIVESSGGWSPDIWRRMATDLGILGLGFSPDWGGLGGDGLDQIPVMEAMGQALVVEPYLETVILCGSLLRSSDSLLARQLAVAVTEGQANLALGHLEGCGFQPYHIQATAQRLARGGWRLTGQKSVVIGASWASHLLVVARIDGNDFDRDGLGLFVIDIGTPGLELAAYPTIDGRRACDITFALDVTDEALLVDGAADALDLALDGATAGLCAEAVGVMRRILGETHAYLSERRQFGVPLATFQALQHQVADMLVALELSSGQAYAAANGLDATASERACAISAAKAFVGQAAHRMGQAAVQLHGGMGMTDELIIGHLFKRAIVIEAQFGSSDYHLNRYRMLKADARGRLH